MSKRYPPIFNVVLFAIAVIFMLLNPISSLVPWLPEAIKTTVTTAIYALNDFFDAAGKFIVATYNTYAIFTLHIVIIALYGKQLFSKDIKAKYHTALKTIDEYKPVDYPWDTEEFIELNKALAEQHSIVAKLYILSGLVLSIIVTNIMCPNFYQFTIMQCWNLNSSDIGLISGVCLGSTLIVALIILCIGFFSLLFSFGKMADSPQKTLEI